MTKRRDLLAAADLPAQTLTPKEAKAIATDA